MEEKILERIKASKASNSQPCAASLKALAAAEKSIFRDTYQRQSTETAILISSFSIFPALLPEAVGLSIIAVILVQVKSI